MPRKARHLIRPLYDGRAWMGCAVWPLLRLLPFMRDRVLYPAGLLVAALAAGAVVLAAVSPGLVS